MAVMLMSLLCVSMGNAAVLIRALPILYANQTDIGLDPVSMNILLSVDSSSSNLFQIASSGAVVASHPLLAGLKKTNFFAIPISTNGFAQGDIYFGDNTDGRLIKVSSSITSPWCYLGSVGTIIDIKFDVSNMFGGGLIVATSLGRVFNVSSGMNTCGNFSELAAFGNQFLTARIEVVPNDRMYGVLAGRIVIGGSSSIWTLTSALVKSPSAPIVTGAPITGLAIIGIHANFFGINPDNARIFTADWMQTESLVGGIFAATSKGMLAMKNFTLENVNMTTGMNLTIGGWQAIMTTVAQVAPRCFLPTAGAPISKFAVLAYATVTSTGLTTIDGDVGLSPGSSVTGLLPSVITGSTYTTASSLAATAQLFEGVLYTALGTCVPETDITGLDLGGLTLTPKVYTYGSPALLNGILTLDARGDSSAIWIFQMQTTLTTGSGSQILLVNGALACNVYWHMGSSATLGTNSAFSGYIVAYSSITVTGGASVNGKLVALNGAVTLDSNAVKTCVASPVQLSRNQQLRNLDFKFVVVGNSVVVVPNRIKK